MKEPLARAFETMAGPDEYARWTEDQRVDEDWLSLRFRRDLDAVRRQDESGVYFEVTDPKTGEAFNFREAEYFLCQSLDGASPASAIIERYGAYHGREIDTEYLQDLLSFLDELGLAEAAPDPRTDIELAAQFERVEGVEGAPSPRQPIPAEVEGGPAAGRYQAGAGAGAGAEVEDGAAGSGGRLSFGNPQRFFNLLAAMFRPLRWLILASVYGLALGLPTAALALYHDAHLLRHALGEGAMPLSYFSRLCFTLVAMNLARCLVHGTLFASYGGKVRSMGVKLLFGIIPRFYVDRRAIDGFSPEQKLWCYAAGPLLRLMFFLFGVGLWLLFRSQGTLLASWAVIIAQGGLVGFVFAMVPVRTSDGYRWIMAIFGLPPSLLQQSVQLLLRVLTGKPLPSSISLGRRVRMLLYAIVIVLGWGWLVKGAVGSIIGGLASTFPGIFGRSTEFTIGVIVVTLVFRWLSPRLRRLAGSEPRKQPEGPTVVQSGRAGEPLIDIPAAADYSARPSPGRGRSRGLRWLVFALLAVGMSSIPCTMRPGGEVQMLPPKQQELQAPISGMVAEVYVEGGDGQIVAKGDVVASLHSPELEKTIATLVEKIEQHKAEHERAKALLLNVTTGAQPEVIAELQASFARAKSEIGLSQNRVRGEELNARHEREKLRQAKKLHAEGVLPLAELQASQHDVAVARLRLDEAKIALSAARSQAAESKARLKLARTGATEGEIEAARQAVNVAQAQLSVAREELSHAEGQKSAGKLRMPMDGFLVTPYLKRKIGSYLAKGDTFATVQENSELIAELLVPEHDAGGIEPGSAATIKLMAFPDRAISGKVQTIEPAGAERAYGRVFAVLIKLDEAPPGIKPGMTGHGKVAKDNHAFITLLVRPILRFLHIEVWSWLP